MPIVHIKQSTVHYLDVGRGPAIVLLHAGASSARQWSTVADSLKLEYRLLIPDLWGFGESDPWTLNENLSLADQASLVADVLKATVNDAVHLVGHSYGGSCATKFVLMYPELVSTVILIEPVLMPLLNARGEAALFSDYQSVANTFIAHAQAGDADAAWQGFVDHRNGKGTWLATSRVAKERLYRLTNASVATLKSNLRDPITRSDLGLIRIPSLVMCGEKTMSADRKVSEIVRDNIPHCRYQIIEGAGHMSPMTHPRLIARAIAAFIKDDKATL